MQPDVSPLWLGIEYGATQVVAIVYLAVGSAILLASAIISLSRWYRGRDVLNRIERAEAES